MTVSLNELKAVSRAELLRCLDTVSGSKTLVWDQALMAPFNLITDKKLLEEHGVEKMLMLPLKGTRFTTLPLVAPLSQLYLPLGAPWVVNFD